MVCKKCGRECPEGNIYCESCGAELDSPVLPDNIDDKGRVKKTKVKAPKPKKEKKEKKTRSPEESAALVKKLKLALGVVIVIAVIILAVFLISLIGSGKGLAAAQKVPLGRNVEFAVSETGLEFAKKSDNGMINSMSDFDYVCISDESVKVNGSKQPKWAIMLNLDGDIISEVEYYDFTQLKLNWKGIRMAQMLDQNSLEYGMKIKDVNKALGLKPYYIKRTVSNESVYCYRYYYTDAESGSDKVYNYYVEFSDIDMVVKNVRYNEINYAAAILSANGGTPANGAHDIIPDITETPEDSVEDVSEEISDEESEAV